MLGFSRAAGAAAPTQEYQLKAVFIYNFIQFVDWPPTPPDAVHAPFVIGVLGEDPFEHALDNTLQGETVNGRPIVVQRYRSMAEVGSCQILFITQSQVSQLDAVLALLRSRPVLTVSDMSDFAGHGGAIEFVK